MTKRKYATPDEKAAAFKRLWADPVYRGTMREKRSRKWDAARHAKQAAFWSSPAGDVARQRTRREVYSRSLHPPALRTPTQRDLGWAAGFLEGEGHFGYQGGGPSSRGGTQRVTATQVGTEPLELLLEIFGGRIRGPIVNPRHPNWQPRHVWDVTGCRARGVMLTMYALMSHRRRKQIQGALHGK